MGVGEKEEEESCREKEAGMGAATPAVLHPTRRFPPSPPLFLYHHLYTPPSSLIQVKELGAGWIEGGREGFDIVRFHRLSLYALRVYTGLDPRPTAASITPLVLPSSTFELAFPSLPWLV